MKLNVQKHSGEETGRRADLSKDIFEIEPNDHAIYLDVKRYLAHKRQGTHKTKERNEIVGSTKKIKRQKGTGTARFGDIKNPIFRGGGRTFGPRPRSYKLQINKKVKALARKSALTYKAMDKNISVLEDFNFKAPKTKEYVSLLKNLSLDQNKTLIVLPNEDTNVFLSARNVQNTKVITASQLNTYDVLNADVLVLSEGSIKKIEEILASS